MDFDGFHLAHNSALAEQTDMSEDDAKIVLKAVTRKLLDEASKMQSKYARGCNAENIKRWFIGDNKDGYYYTNKITLADLKDITTQNFFDFYDN